MINNNWLNHQANKVQTLKCEHKTKKALHYTELFSKKPEF